MNLITCCLHYFYDGILGCYNSIMSLLPILVLTNLGRTLLGQNAPSHPYACGEPQHGFALSTVLSNTETQVYPGFSHGAVRPVDCADALYFFALGVPVEGVYKHDGRGGKASRSLLDDWGKVTISGEWACGEYGWQWCVSMPAARRPPPPFIG
jgi:hypothetical protein